MDYPLGAGASNDLLKFGAERSGVECARLFSEMEMVDVVAKDAATSIEADDDVAFAIFVGGGGDPLTLACTAPERRRAWIDAFRTCCARSVRTRAQCGCAAAREIVSRVGWQHRIVRASLFSLVICGDATGLAERLARPPPGDAEMDDRDEYRGFTALHYAVVLDRPQRAEALLGHGADANLRDDDGKTPLDHGELVEAGCVASFRPPPPHMQLGGVGSERRVGQEGR